LKMPTRAEIMYERERLASGMKIRRNVLGDAHVDRAVARTTPLTAEFQDLITRYAWGEIWTRPGLDVRARRMLVIGTLLALGRFDELRMHFRSAIEERGLSVDEIKEVVLQQAIYCGVPAANTAFEVLREVVEEAEGDSVGG
jgi:4-carboxymuconolactone decarboxylase